MRFSPEDRQFIQALAQQHGVSVSAVETLWVAVAAGHGALAQFNHPELGGMGQWMAGGMTMIGDFSNHRLKATVADLCQAIAAYLRDQAQAAGPSSSPGFAAPFSATPGWWPQEFGPPTASGGQNDLHYAYFAHKQRLAIRLGDQVTLYDSGDHRIDRVAQQQDRQQKLIFRSQKGEVALDELRKVGEYEV